MGRRKKKEENTNGLVWLYTRVIHEVTLHKVSYVSQMRTSQYFKFLVLSNKSEQYKKTVTQIWVSTKKITHMKVFTIEKERKKKTLTQTRCFRNKLTHKGVRTMQSKGQGSTCPSKGLLETYCSYEV